MDSASHVQQTELSNHIWSQLPQELVREVFLILAKTDIEEARELRLVSSDVNVLVLPIIFRDVVMVSPEHVTQFTTILLPKRKNYVPALKSKLHVMPRLLSTYKPDSWVLVVNDRRPSIETALASVAPAFVGVSKLAISCQNLSSNAFWLRRHAIHPKLMLLVHFGNPNLVNFHDPIFKSVTHLYTSVTHGHRSSTVADLPCITHLAVSARTDLAEQTARNIASSLSEILQLCKTLTSLVFVMTHGESEINPGYEFWASMLKKCLVDKRFTILPYYRPPRLEWSDILEGRPTLWDRADELRRAGLRRSVVLQQQVQENAEGRDALFLLLDRGEEAWDIDLIKRQNFQSQVDDPELRGVGFMSAFG